MEGDDGGASGLVDGIDGVWQASARGRVGVAMDRVLLYATGGWQWANYDAFQNTTDSRTGTVQGWTAGAGIEIALMHHLIIGAEYRYTDLLGSVSTSVADYELSDYHTVRGRVSFKIGGDHDSMY